MHEALLYNKLEDGKVRCSLCAHRRFIAEGKRGLCGVRENPGGVLFSLVYGKAIATHVDPIEEEAALQLSSRFPRLLGGDGGVQHELPPLPERRYLPVSPGKASTSRARHHKTIIGSPPGNAIHRVRKHIPQGERPLLLPTGPVNLLPARLFWQLAETCQADLSARGDAHPEELG